MTALIVDIVTAIHHSSANARRFTLPYCENVFDFGDFVTPFQPSLDKLIQEASTL